MVDGDGRIRRNLPGDIDGLCTLCNGRKGCRVGLPVMIPCVEVDDVIVCDLFIDGGVLGGEIGVRHCAEQLPYKEHGADDDGEGGQADHIVQRVL